MNEDQCTFIKDGYTWWGAGGLGKRPVQSDPGYEEKQT